jgi:heme A synthase
MFLFMISALVLFLLVGGAVLALGKKAKGVRVSEMWKLFFGLILIGVSRGMSTADVSLRFPKIGMLTGGSVLIVWFVVSIWIQGRKRTAEQQAGG